jgi:hypothetical protein
MTAYCGLNCFECPAFQATLRDDNAEREKIAEMWSTPEYVLTTRDVDCDGCTSHEGRRMSFCEGCGIRKCNIEKGFETCASCDDYRCEMLVQSHSRAPKAFETLEEIRNNPE